MNSIPAVPSGGGTDGRRDQVNVNLCGLGPSLRAYAERKQMSVACAVRMAVADLLDSGERQVDSEPAPEVQACGPKMRVLLRLPEASAGMLLSRARKAGVSRSRYVILLMEGKTPSPLPADHDRLIASLMASTVQLAAQSVDLNAFMRLLGRVPASELEPYRAGLRSLIPAVRSHLEMAAALLAELEKTKRWRT